MTGRLGFASALAAIAIAALSPANALAVGPPEFTPTTSPVYTNVWPALAWTPFGDEVTFDVMRATTVGTTACVSGAATFLVNTAATTWTDSTAAADTSYCYWVRGVDGVGVPGLLSAQKVVVYDTQDPTGTVTAPFASASVRGSVVVTSSDATDPGATGVSGVARVAFEYSPGVGTWTTIGTDVSSAGGWAFDWDTPGVIDGTYDLRAVVTDRAGNDNAAPVVTTVLVDNSAPTVSQVSPAAGVQVTGASVALAATAGDAGTGLSSVRFERADTGTSGWTTIGTDGSSAGGWAFDWNTTAGVNDGHYDLRAVAVDLLGNEAASARVANVRIDNTPPGAPGAPTAAAPATNTAVTLIWPDTPRDVASSDVVGYRIYRDGSSTPLNASLVTGSTYIDTSVALDGSADGAHTYTLRAQDLTQLSPLSDSVSVTLDTADPAAPSVTATPQSSGAVSLSWSTPTDRAASSGAAGTISDVVVRRSAAGGAAPASAADGISVCTPGSAHTCTDANTARGATYAYAVFVRDGAGNASRGTATAKVSDVVPPPPPIDPKKPAAPTAVRTTVDHLGRTVLAWKLPPGKDLARIVVVRGTAKRKPRTPLEGTKVYSGRGTRVTLNLAPGTATWLAVFAINRAGKVSPAVAKRIAIGRISPGEGAELDGAVKLRWVRDRKADYYNVQIFRKGKRVLIDWPRATRLGLAKGKLANGDYTAYVWPGYGELSQARFGKLIGSASFSYRR